MIHFNVNRFDVNREQAYADLVGARQADGLITLLPHIPRIVAAGRPPIVNACEYVKDPKVTSVYVDTVATDTFAASATSLMLLRWGAAETLFARLRGVDLDLVIVRL